MPLDRHTGSDDPRVDQARAMRRRGATLSEIARAVKVTPPTVHRWTKGVVTPQQRERINLAAETGQSRVIGLDQAHVRVGELLETPEIARLITELEATRKTGRPGAPIRTMVGLYLVKGLCDFKKWTGLLDAVAEHHDMRAVLAVDGAMPSEWACYRFGDKVREQQGVLDDVFERPRREARERREAMRAEAFEKVQATLKAGLPPSWHPRTLSARPLSVQERSELAGLVAQQEKDAKWADRVSRPRHVSGLDDRFEGEDGEFAGDSAEGPAHMDPAILLTANTEHNLHSVVGDLTVEAVERMDMWTLGRLQDRITEAGLVRPQVQRKERERLRAPIRKRGEAPVLMFERMSPSRRSRKQRIAQGERKTRSSRKPRKRWEREAA